VDVARRGQRHGLVAAQETVTRHQPIRTTTMTVVSCMIRSAFWLDSCMPMMFFRQK